MASALALRRTHHGLRLRQRDVAGQGFDRARSEGGCGEDEQQGGGWDKFHFYLLEIKKLLFFN